jgi:hypothetical protein
MQAAGPITDAFRAANYVEAGLWAVIGIGFAVQAIRRSNRQRSICAVAAVTFLAFGGSDVVESRTGAWWSPGWLLVWKGACVVVFAGLILLYVMDRRNRA